MYYIKGGTARNVTLGNQQTLSISGTMNSLSLDGSLNPSIRITVPSGTKANAMSVNSSNAVALNGRVGSLEVNGAAKISTSKSTFVSSANITNPGASMNVNTSAKMLNITAPAGTVNGAKAGTVTTTSSASPAAPAPLRVSDYPIGGGSSGGGHGPTPPAPKITPVVNVAPTISGAVYGTSLTISNSPTAKVSASNTAVPGTWAITNTTPNAGTRSVTCRFTPTDTTKYNTFTYDVAGVVITAKSVTITGVTAANKAYDGNTTATASNLGTVSGTVGTDVVTSVAGTLTFADKDVASGIAVTATGFTLGGAAAGNYVLSPQPTVSSANITVKTLTMDTSAGETLSGSYNVGDPCGNDITTIVVDSGTGENVSGSWACTVPAAGPPDPTAQATFTPSDTNYTGTLTMTITFTGTIT